jgi:hypothetical protein
MKVGKISSKTEMKVCGIKQKFSWSFTFGFNEISFHFISLMSKIFCFDWNSQLPMSMSPPLKNNHTEFAHNTLPEAFIGQSLLATNTVAAYYLKV